MWLLVHGKWIVRRPTFDWPIFSSGNVDSFRFFTHKSLYASHQDTRIQRHAFRIQTKSACGRACHSSLPRFDDHQRQFLKILATHIFTIFFRWRCPVSKLLKNSTCSNKTPVAAGLDRPRLVMGPKLLLGKWSRIHEGKWWPDGPMNRGFPFKGHIKPLVARYCVDDTGIFSRAWWRKW